MDLIGKKVFLLNRFEVREIRHRLDSGRQVVLITTDTYMPMQQVAGALFSRCSQENCFKNMRHEFNLDALPIHDLETLHPDTLVVNPARRQLEKQIKIFRSRLGSLPTNREAATIQPRCWHKSKPSNYRSKSKRRNAQTGRCTFLPLTWTMTTNST